MKKGDIKGKVKDEIKGKLIVILVLILLCAGIITKFLDFVLWLFVLQNATPKLSTFGNIVVRVFTFGISYALVGFIFDAFGKYNAKYMSLSYYIISTLVGFGIAYVVWTIEEHIVTVLIIVSIVLALAVVYIIFQVLTNKRIAKTNG